VFVALKKQRFERVELFLDKKRYLLHKLLFKILCQLNITTLICMNIYNYFIFSLEQETNGKDVNGKDMNGENMNDKDVNDEISNKVINQDINEDIYSEECSNDGIQTRSRTVRGRRNRKVTTRTTRAINRRTRGRVIFLNIFF